MGFWRTTSVEGDMQKPKLSKSTEMVLCPCLFVIGVRVS
jgi:hypothetical protein